VRITRDGVEGVMKMETLTYRPHELAEIVKKHLRAGGCMTDFAEVRFSDGKVGGDSYPPFTFIRGVGIPDRDALKDQVLGELVAEPGTVTSLMNQLDLPEVLVQWALETLKKANLISPVAVVLTGGPSPEIQYLATGEGDLGPGFDADAVRANYREFLEKLPLG